MKKVYLLLLLLSLSLYANDRFNILYNYLDDAFKSNSEKTIKPLLNKRVSSNDCSLFKNLNINNLTSENKFKIIFNIEENVILKKLYHDSDLFIFDKKEGNKKLIALIDRVFNSVYQECKFENNRTKILEYLFKVTFYNIKDDKYFKRLYKVSKDRCLRKSDLDKYVNSLKETHLNNMSTSLESRLTKDGINTKYKKYFNLEKLFELAIKERFRKFCN